MLNINILQGRMVETPELKHTESGIAVTRFRIAVDRDYAAQGKERETDFFNIVAWRSTAEFICKYFTKGQMILLSGRSQSRQYTDQNGQKRTVYEVVAGEVQFCGKKQEQGQAQAQQAFTEIPDLTDDDLPF